MIKLRRSVECKIFEVKATIAVGRDRPEFLAVALLARDLDGPISGRDLSEHLLAGIDVLSDRVLERSVSMGLLDWSEGCTEEWRCAELTQAGKDAIKREKILIPEESVWRFYYLDDPIIRDRLIHFEPVPTPNASEERKNLKRQQGQRMPDRGDSTPAYLKRHVEKTTFTSAVDGTPFRLQEISKTGKRMPPERLTLHAEITPDSRLDVTLKGRLTAPSRNGNGRSLRVDRHFDPPKGLASVAYDEVWRELATQGRGEEPREYGAGNFVVPVHFDENLNAAARNSMHMDIRVLRPDLKSLGLGQFDTTTLKEVQIEPDTGKDARQWAKWLLLDGMDDYKTPGLIRKDEQEIHKKFPNHKISLTDPDALLRDACDATDKPWSRFLLAPHDLNLWR